MLSPSPISLLCALLLCLPLAIFFTLTTPLSPSSSTITHIFPTRFTSNNTKPNPNPKTTPSTLLSRHNTKIFPPSPSTTNSTNPTPSSSPPPHSPPSPLSPPPSPSLPSSPPPPPRPPIEYDDPEDNKLFQQASRVNQNPNPKPTKRKKLAFMFLTTTPLPFAPLWEAFFNNIPKNQYNIYIHADPSFNYSPPFSGVFSNRVIKSKPTHRNTPTLISAARRLLARALLDDKSNYMFVILSQSCIPLHTFRFTYKVLTKSRKSFVEILDNEPRAWERWTARGEQAMLPEVGFDEFRIGSQFFAVKRKHALTIVRDRRLWLKFKQECLMVEECYPEEHYFATLLNMVDPKGCVPTTLTHVDWSESEDGHPKMYESDEVGPELILALRSHRPRYGDEVDEIKGLDSSNGARYGDGINGSDSSSISRYGNGINGSSSGLDSDSSSMAMYGNGINGSSSELEVSKKPRDPFLFARKFSPESLEKLMSLANDVILKD